MRTRPTHLRLASPPGTGAPLNLVRSVPAQGQGPLQRAQAEKLFDLSGNVALLDGLGPKGVKVKLQVDLDRNHELDSFETVTGSVSSDGTYKLSYTAGEGGPLAEGEALANGKVRGVLSGGVTPPQATIAALCKDAPCNTGVVSEDGTLTFIVPVIPRGLPLPALAARRTG